MYLCDTCAAAKVLQGLMRPLNEVWGANNIPWKVGNCDECGSKENIQNCSEQEMEGDILS